MQRTPFWPASWLPAVDKSRGPKSVEVQSVWEVYDDRVQFMSRQDALLLDESLNAGDVSQAWLVWSSAAETALADAYRISGGPAPNRGLFSQTPAHLVGLSMHARPRVWKRLHCSGYPGVSAVDCKRRRCNQHDLEDSPVYPRTGVG